MICPHCQTPNDDQATHCSNCGRSLISPEDLFGKTEIRPESDMSRDDSDLWGETEIGPGQSSASFEAGRRIAGRYEIVRELGRGGMGVVYLVKDTHLRDQEVALKMIHPALIRHPEAGRRFEDEVIISRELAHDHIIQVFSLERDGDDRFFTMEYLPGRSLREEIEGRQARDEKFSLSEAATVIDQVLDALTYAHQRTIHRDIKPDNIMLVGDWPEVKVKVMDFGIAKTLSASRMTTTAQSMGTAYYMAPEQLAGAKNVTPASDLYSVGAVFYEMLTGEVPAGRFALPGELVDGLPPALDDLVDKALQARPENRFGAADEFRSALAEVASESRQWEEEERLRLEEEARRQEETERQRQEEERRKAEAERLRQEEERKRQEEEGRRVEAKRRLEEEQDKKRREKESRRLAEVERRKREKEAKSEAVEARRAEDKAPRSRKRLVVWLIAAGVLLAAAAVGGYIGVTWYQNNLADQRRLAAARKSLMKLSPEQLRAAKRIGRPATITNSIGMKFVLIPAGSFMMGSSQGVDEVISRIKNKKLQALYRTRMRWILAAEHPRHRVVISRLFYMQTTEVTEAQYQRIMGKNPSYFKGCGRCPVNNVSWKDAQEFIRRLNAREKTNKYRLPTEAEWEYACRAGTTTPFYFGQTISTDQANYHGNYVYGSGRKGVCRKTATRAGSFPSNRWGLYDMHGNVWEWCSDWYGEDYYKSSPGRDPKGPNSGRYRVFRGGSWYDGPRLLRSAFRSRDFPRNVSIFIGFRVVIDHSRKMAAPKKSVKPKPAPKPVKKTYYGRNTFFIKAPWKMKKPAVRFTHAAHYKQHRIKCVKCHHVYKGQKNGWKPGQTVISCFACHKKRQSESARGGGNTAFRAFHTLCRTCHKSTPGGRGPRRCLDCHAKKRR